MIPPAQTPPSPPLFAEHSRSFEANRFVYAVVSRRSGGISIGINLNPDKVCNFDCIYCQVDRVSQSETRFVAAEALLAELEQMLELVSSGRLFAHPKFAGTPKELRRLNDIAFSGDGEPTTYRNFDEIVAACAELKRRRGLDTVKMVLISNASMFHRPAVERGLAILDANQGEIWAKLEAGTEEYYKLVERTTIPFQRILDNITAAARRRALVIQALFMRIHGQPPSPAEQEAFCDRLNEITAAGGKIRLVQVYTVARPPAESFVTPMDDAELDELAERVRRRTALAVEAFYGYSAEADASAPVQRNSK
ncbi:MAG TPA: radical SAM protein [Planctomycetaceae bacterium]|nr:radical SAM protein [Planctomycetaceae bacterium]